MQISNLLFLIIYHNFYLLDWTCMASTRFHELFGRAIGVKEYRPSHLLVLYIFQKPNVYTNSLSWFFRSRTSLSFNLHVFNSILLSNITYFTSWTKVDDKILNRSALASGLTGFKLGHLGIGGFDFDFNWFCFDD